MADHLSHLGDLLDPWDFSLPEAQIAREPAPERDQSRLYRVGAEPGVFADIVAELRAGDLLVMNDVRVFRARLRAFRASGGAVEAMISAPARPKIGQDGTYFHAFLRPGRRLLVGDRLACGDGALVLVALHPDGTWTVRAEPDLDTLAASAGEVPLPPYLGRAPTAEDAERYQTVFAKEGHLRASAAPTAGLHMTDRLLQAIEVAGVQVARVALEVGAGTFAPLTSAAWTSGKLHTERYIVPTASWEAVITARSEGRRVVALGTTTLRVLESMTGPGAGETDLFIRPGYAFKRVDALITNFHLPRSSLLMLVTAFGGMARVLDAYKNAVNSGFRFYSYGDAMWLTRHTSD